MVRLESITKSFNGKKIIADFSLGLGAGEIFVLLGRSGCGKTTLLRLIAGFERADSGRIFIAGEDVGPLPIERRPVGFIFQSHALFPHMSVYDNIAVGPRVRKVPEDEIARRIAELLEITRLTGQRHAFPGQLSGGESQRVAIARAVINRPKVLLLDEPLSALDPNMRKSLRTELVEMQKTFGITFLFVTHDQEEAMSLATRIGVLEDGALLQVGTPTQLYDQPNCPFVTRFLGDSNCLSLSGRECFIRPEKMFIATTPREDDSHQRLEGVIHSRSFFGDHTKYRVELDSREVVHVLVPHKGQETSPHRDGERVSVMFNPRDLLAFDKKPTA